jgi:hypothetical protein
MFFRELNNKTEDAVLGKNFGVAWAFSPALRQTEAWS